MTLLDIAFATVIFGFAGMLCMACWGLFEETEVGKLFIKRLKKKLEDEEEE